ncbi:cytochrome P450 [Coralloluteibacterium thermophilus]|uniref:Cytochrome P450 n=1 Tax=Coralloluteibacterium thermophilum TaxID=2707049 RepID=A0ABV9NLA5_9GAMM
MPGIPRDSAFDSSIAFMREGYAFIPRRRARYGSDLFQARIMLRKAIFVGGPDAARMFYQPDRFTRKGALPPSAVALLQDYGSVQLKDGAAHRSRKRLFTGLLDVQGTADLATAAEDAWAREVPAWTGRVVLHDAFQALLCRAACRWAGIPEAQADLPRRTREFAAMIDGAGAVGPRNWRGLLLRARCERWARGLVRAVRDGSLDPGSGSPLAAVAAHCDPDGEPLPVKIAAIELLNLLRPTVAVARFLTFGALALHAHPEWRARLAQGDRGDLERFAQEVRRFYPFFPAVGGRATHDFEWQGHRFRKGDWVMLDLYGSNRDPRLWNDPERFDPERFRDWQPDPYTLVPQGGGELGVTHRCPGERATVEIMMRLMRRLAGEIDYAVPAQDLGIDLGRMPTLPASGFVVEDVRPRGAGKAASGHEKAGAGPASSSNLGRGDRI